MSRIVPNILTLEQHIHAINTDPHRYRPPCCPHCGYAVLWGHGSYTRKPDRGLNSGGSLNPVAIPRFICSHTDCGKSCSRLPECIAPRRWYLWIVQQQLLLGLLGGHSLHDLARQYAPARSTLRRWRQWLMECFSQFHLRLVGVFPSCTHDGNWGSYWGRCLSKEKLSHLMAALDRYGVCVP